MAREYFERDRLRFRVLGGVGSDPIDVEEYDLFISFRGGAGTSAGGGVQGLASERGISKYDFAM